METNKQPSNPNEVKARLEQEGVVFFRDICEELSYDEEDAHAYTVGNSLKDRPELFIICGEFNTRVTNEDLVKNTEAAASLLNSMVSNWDNNPVELGHVCQDYMGRKYIVDDPDEITEYLKAEKMHSANEYLEKKDYKVWLLVPLDVISRLTIQNAGNIFRSITDIANDCDKSRTLH